MLRAIRFLPYRFPYAIWRRLRPVRAGRMLFLSDSHDGFTGNMLFLRRALEKQHPGAQIIGVFKPHLAARRSVMDILRLPYLIATSEVIVLDDFYPLIYRFRLRPESRLVQLWHAAGAFKRVGHSRAGLPGGPTPGSEIHRNYTDAIVSSEGVVSDHADAFGISRPRVHPWGVPRSDVFFDDAYMARTRARVRSRFGIADDERFVVYAPTFRGNGQRSATAAPEPDWSQLADELGPTWRIGVRQHPFVSAATLPPGIIDATAEPDMNDLLIAADVLVTDYSSAIFEFALLRRPIVFYVPDLAEYTAARSFYRPFDEYTIGPVVEDAAELGAAIGAASVDHDRFDAFLTEFCGALDGRSSERIAAHLLDSEGLSEAVDASASRTVLQRLRLDALAAYAARFAVTVISLVMRPLPRRNKILLLTRQSSRPPADFVMLKEAIHRADPSVEVVTIAKMMPPGVVKKLGYAAHLVKKMYHAETSRVMVVDGYSIIASTARHSSGLTIVQVWHALGALKKFGLSIVGRPAGRDPLLAKAMRMHAGYDLVIASAERCRGPYAEAFGVHPSKVVVAPLPRVDRLTDPAAARRARERFHRLYPDLVGQRIALFAPTFPVGGTSLEIDPVELTHALSTAGYTTMTKFHPLVPAPTDPALRTAPGMSTQDLLLIADVFITDYSSAVFEAAVAGVPSYLLAPDLDRYSMRQDFYLTYPDDLGLPCSSSVQDTVEQIRAGLADTTTVHELRDRYVPFDFGEASSAADNLAQIVLREVRPPSS